MTMELYYLILFALLIIATIFTQQVSSLFSEGLLPLFGSREGIKFTGLTGRLERSITNSAISMAVILPPVFAIEVTESSTPSGILAMQIFWELAYFMSYHTLLVYLAYDPQHGLQVCCVLSGYLFY